MSVALEPLKLARVIRSRFSALSSAVGELLPDEETIAARLRRLPLRDLASLRASLEGKEDVPSVDGVAAAVLDLPTREPKLPLVERAVIARALAESRGNKSAAARLLGMDRKAFVRRVARAGE